MDFNRLSLKSIDLAVEKQRDFDFELLYYSLINQGNYQVRIIFPTLMFSKRNDFILKKNSSLPIIINFLKF